jgi:DNA-binding GntR family transcriptional regulator
LAPYRRFEAVAIKKLKIKLVESDGSELPVLNRSQSTMRSGITEALRLRIIDGTFSPGIRISEDWVAREMGVSRGPVRESIRELENEGLLIVLPYRGTFVNEISTTELRKTLIPIRLILEQQACAVALPNMTEANFQVLAGIVDEMRVVAKKKDLDTLVKLVELDVQYHQYIMNLSEQYHAIQLWNNIQPRIRVGFYRLGLRHNDFQEITAEHDKLLDALRSKNSKIVFPALEHHICTDQFRLLDRIESEKS